MRLSDEEEKILNGKRGRLLQHAMEVLVRYGIAMDAERLIAISSAHTSFVSIRNAAMCFPPRGVKLTENDVAEFGRLMADAQVRVKTTTNPGILDIEKWKEMGANEEAYQATRQTEEIARKCGILATSSCTPYLIGNTPIMGEHCSWSETSAIVYCNSFLGARSNRDSHEASLASALLGITPEFGMHLDENRRGTDLVSVQCGMNWSSDWGALGYFTGDGVGIGVPVFSGLRRPSVEEAKQLGSSMNVPGCVELFHIPQVTPEAPSIEAAFGGNVARRELVFDELARGRVYEHLNHEPEGKVDMVFLGCPHATLYEIKEVSRLLEGKHVAKGTELWIMTSYPIRATAVRLGYDQIIEASGGKLFADGCLTMYYGNHSSKRPVLERVATDSAKQAYGVRRAFGSRVCFADTARCVQMAIDGGSHLG